MKSTDIARREREIRRSKKKQEQISRHLDKRKELSIGDYIKKLYGMFYFDDSKIYNTKDSPEIAQLLQEVKTHLPAEQWDTVLRKAVKKTQTKAKEEAFKDLKGLLEAQDQIDLQAGQ